MKQSIIAGPLGNRGERFLMEGYKEEIDFRQKIEMLRGIKHLEGIEINSDPDGEDSDLEMTRKLLEDNGFVCAAVGASIVGRKHFGHGSLTSRDPKVRQIAVDIIKHAMDRAAYMGAKVVNVWPGQDGIDYPLCQDYSWLYNTFLENICLAADHNPEILLGIESKPRDPRMRSLFANASDVLVLCLESKRKNVGATIDIGHIFCAGGNASQAAQMLADRGKLFHLHTNDNYSYWDDDMIAGSVRFAEYIELCYTLRKIRYEGWCTVDIFPLREDSRGCVEESVAYMAIFDQIVEKIGMEKLRARCQEGSAPKLYRLLRDAVFREFA